MIVAYQVTTFTMPLRPAESRRGCHQDERATIDSVFISSGIAGFEAGRPGYR